MLLSVMFKAPPIDDVVTTDSVPVSVSPPTPKSASTDASLSTCRSLLTVKLLPTVELLFTVKLLPTVKLLVIVTLSGSPICKVWLLAAVSISFAVPEIVKFCVSRFTTPVPASPKKFRLTRAVTYDAKSSAVRLLVKNPLSPVVSDTLITNVSELFTVFTYGYE